MIAPLLVQSVIAAVLLAAALRVHGALGWFVAAPFALLLRDSVRVRDALLFGAVFGATAGSLSHAGWLAETAQRYFDAPEATAWAAAIALALATGATQGALLGVALHRMRGLPGVGSIVAGAAIWVLWEWLGLHVFPHYPWASLVLGSVRPDTAASLLPSADGASLVLAAARWVGQSGVTFAMCAVGLALGAALAPSTGIRRLPIALLLAALLGALTFAASHQAAAPGASLCTLAGIDAAAPEARGSAQRYLATSRRAAAAWSPAPSAVVWPESALDSSPELDTRLRQQLAKLAADLGTAIIAGGPRVGWNADWQERRFNSAFRIDGGGALRAYDKRRIVAFTEYWPWPWVAPPSWLQTSSVEAGRDAVLFDAGACKLGMLICFEAEAPPFARGLARDGASAILVLSNDADLPRAAVELEAAQVRLRAAETGLPVVRVANAGMSFVALPSGGIAAADTYTVRAGRTAPAVWIAPWVLGASAMLALLGAATSSARRRRPTRT